MSIPFALIGLILFVNRKRLKDDFKANPNAWWRGCFWIGLSITFLSACFVGWSCWSIFNYYFGLHYRFEVWVFSVPLLGIHLLIMGIGILLMVIGRKNSKVSAK